MSKDIDINDLKDLQCYADIYSNKRYISNIIKMVSVMISIICTIIYAELKRRNKV